MREVNLYIGEWKILCISNTKFEETLYSCVIFLIINNNFYRINKF